MNTIILILSYITITLITIYIYKRKTKNINDKLSLIICFIIFIILLKLYHYNPKEAYSFINNCFSTIIGALISGTILLDITLGQIKRNEDLEIENLRINNIPLLEYKLETKDNNLVICIKNVGKNIAKNCTAIKDKSIYNIDNQNHISVNEEKQIIIPLEEQNISENIIIEINYQDIISNKYIQKINISYTTNNKNIKLNKISIKNEKLVK